MNATTDYDHRLKVGNPGDLFKHALLAHVVRWKAAKGGGFSYAETHTGYPIYQLAVGGEWRLGAGVMSHPPPAASPLTSYWVHALGECPPIPGSLYPGSSLLVHRIVSAAGGVPVMRLWERSPPVVDALQAHFSAMDGVEVLEGDGYCGIQDGAGEDLVLVDPVQLELSPIVEVLSRLSRRGAPFLCWVPRRGTAAGQEGEASRRLLDETSRWYGAESAQWIPWRDGICGCRIICSLDILPLVSEAAVELRRIVGWKG
ncbi:23S rRNA (adenine(2030)-N(6))-methyltransferase RlmJ [Endothiovibrio diazotrophicus]